MNGLTKASSVSSGGGTVAGKSFEIRPRSLRLSDGVDRWVRDSNDGRWHTPTSSRDDRWQGRGGRWITPFFNVRFDRYEAAKGHGPHLTVVLLRGPRPNKVHVAHMF